MGSSIASLCLGREPNYELATIVFNPPYTIIIMGVWIPRKKVLHGRRVNYGIFILIIVIYIALMKAFVETIKYDPVLPVLIVAVMVFLIPVFVFVMDLLFNEDQT